MGIVRDQKVLGIWENEAQDARLAEFIDLSGGKERFRNALVIVRQTVSKTAKPNEPPLLN